MDFKDIAGVLGKIAPMIASGLGGPLAGTAVAALEGVFGKQDGATPDDKQVALTAALTGATPDQLLALKKADQDYAAQMSALGFTNEQELEKIASQDRDSARKREEDVKDSTPRVLAYALVVGFFATLAFMLFSAVPAASRDLLNIMLGMLGTSFVSVISYYFGSTHGSAETTRLLAASTPVVTK